MQLKAFVTVNGSSQHTLLSPYPLNYDFNRPFSTLLDLCYNLEDSLDAPPIPDENASPAATVADVPADAPGSPPPKDQQDEEEVVEII
uniref:Uncharacterized protein n=1 Tax=Panagrolaimus sp. ES5 TaxID=591445 RepID=A0AC34GB69_9BILA